MPAEEVTEAPVEVVSEVVLTGSGQGFGGQIPVEVIMDSDNKIKAITIGEHNESAGISDGAIDNMPGRIIENQSLMVDTVSGATTSSKGILSAVENALVSGGYDVADFKTEVAKEEITKTNETLHTDIVIIGAGGAGLTAAIEATQAGKDVIIVEKMSFAGGNTLKATGGMNATETSVQAAENIPDTVETFVKDTIKGGYELNDVELVNKMAEESAEAIDWLASIDAPLVQLSFSGGATYSRIHQPEGGEPVGAFLVEHLLDEAEELGIEIMYNTEATQIVMEDGVASGILANSEAVDYMIDSEAVILASGGFGANEEMYASYKPELEGFVTTNHPGATGDGISMAQEVGAGLTDIEQIQIHPTVHQGTSIMVTEGVRGDGGILVNQSGKRFTNELLTRDVVSAAEIAQDGGFAYVIFDQFLREHLGATETYIKSGIAVQADTIEELAEMIEIDPATLANTLKTWNEAVANKNDAEFSRSTGMEHDLSSPPYYAVKVSPGVHHTMGGVSINPDAEVLTAEGDVIPGLFAAGEVVGGVHGGNRLGGNAVADIIVFGRVAAQSANDYIAE
ncbi:flavocytochrome c [Candidatus Epulonipiscium fishelsonii]|uniref:Flavocytochrome c n=1 Tax=Candidatus Epulonipiscium fishelsonii TaxID=77094 RepID=A0ACC8X929_9FIRM|nr:flavocytochrome c [Epulopiscium sp. SCG-B11WGA-EpuloA1]